MKKEYELSRRKFLKFSTLFFSVAFLPDQIIEIKNESPRSYIAQDTLNSCGYAAMAMIIADNKDNNVEDIYKKISDYYKDIGEYDNPLSVEALEDYMKRKELLNVKRLYKSDWNLDDVKDHLRKYGSAIFDVTSNYGEAIPFKNGSNHWIVIDKVEQKIGGNYSLIRDPLYSNVNFNPIRKPKSFMITNVDGSLYIPTDILIHAMGGECLYLSQNSNIEQIKSY